MIRARFGLELVTVRCHTETVLPRTAKAVLTAAPALLLGFSAQAQGNPLLSVLSMRLGRDRPSPA